MVDFSDRKAIERWFADIEPAERRSEVAVALAARAALRVISLLSARLSAWPPAKLAAESLLSLRAVAVAWTAAKYPAHGSELREAAYASVTAAGRAAAASVAAASVVDAAYDADATHFASGDAVAYAAVAHFASGEAVARAAAAHIATPVIAAAVDAAHDAADVDRAFVDLGRSGAELIGLPLWPKGAPNLAADDWQALKAALLGADEGWGVWTDWYEARLAGDADHPLNEALEIARATIPDEVWGQGPAVVNAEIKRLDRGTSEPATTPSGISIPGH